MRVLPNRYNKENIARAIKDPTKIRDEAKRITKELYSPIRRLQFESKYNKENIFDPVDQSWDNLIILDACRYDILAENNIFEGTLDYNVLDSSTSPEFINNYINGKKLHDTVYISANPFTSRISPGTFYKTYTPFQQDNTEVKNQKYKLNDLSDSWDPQTVYDLSIDGFEQNPEKRQIVHFMQPHAPYFGKRAKDLRNELNDEGVRFWAWDESLDKEGCNSDEVLSHLLAAAEQGYISKKELSEVYVENLLIVLDYVKKYSESVSGKTVISSDHGEMLGESSILHGDLYGHGRKIYTKELRKVPWFTLSYKERRSVTAEEPVEQRDNLNKDLDKKLRALGYK